MDQQAGIDIIRIDDLTWLNGEGKQEIAIFELEHDCRLPMLDAALLKRFVTSLRDRSFPSDAHMIAELSRFREQDPAFANYEKKLTFKEDLPVQPAAPEPSGCYDLGFICEMSEVVFRGTLEIFDIETDKLSNQPIITLLDALRKSRATPSSFVVQVLKKLEQLHLGAFTLSILIHHPDGFQLQSIRHVL